MGEGKREKPPRGAGGPLTLALSIAPVAIPTRHPVQGSQALLG